MKKLAVCLILSLVMCLAMAFPASAAVTYKPEWHSYVQGRFDTINANSLPKLPAAYKNNYFVTTDSLYNASTPSIIYVIYTDSPVFKPGSKFYVGWTMGNGYLSFDTVCYTAGSIKPTSMWINTTAPSASFWNAGNVLITNFSTVTISEIDYSTDSRIYSTLSPPVNTSSLQSLINTAKAKTNTGYTNTSWQSLQSAITSAENLLKTTGYTQSQVDSAKNTLQATLNGLQLLPDISSLQALINQAKGIQGNYTPESWQALQLAITDAENLLKTTDYTQSQVDNAKTTLQAALNSLELLPDTTELSELLVEADQIDDIGYTAPTWTRFDNARTAGHTLMARPSYTQPEVNATTFELASAMNGLIILPDTSYLTALLADADLINDIGYTSLTWTRFINARSAGHALLNLTNYTVSDVSDCVTELMQAMNGLTLVPTNPPVVPPVATPGIPPPQYYAIPPGSMQYLDIADGYTPEHLAPIKESLMQNLDASRKFGLPLYFISLIPLLTVIIIRKCIHMESHTIDIYPRTRLSDARTYNPYKMGSGSSKYD